MTTHAQLINNLLIAHRTQVGFLDALADVEDELKRLNGLGSSKSITKPDEEIPLEPGIANAIAARVLRCFLYTDGSDEERQGKPYWDNVSTPLGDITTAGDLLAYLRGSEFQ